MTSMLNQRPKRIGILFVHGIGEQNRGDTLLGFGEPLFRWLCQWLSKGSQELSWHDLRLSNTSLSRSLEPAEYRPAITELGIIIPPGSPDTYQLEWVMAESWWAQDFTPPSAGQLARWAVGIGPWMVWRQVRHLADRCLQTLQMLYQPMPENISNPLLLTVALRTISSTGSISVGGYAIRAVTAIFLVLRVIAQLVLGFLVAFVVQLLSIILLIPAWIPLLSNFVVGAQRLLANSVGDSYILVTSPLRFNAMISQVENDLKWLAERDCDKLVVIAHSQGAAVAYEALKHSKEPHVDLFITFGSGLSKLKAIQRVLPYQNRILIGGIFGLIGMPLFLVGLLGWFKQEGLLAIVPLPLITQGAAVLCLVLGSALLGLVSLPILRGFVTSLTAEELETDLEHRQITKPGGMKWYDYYASSDPVPDGRLLNVNRANICSMVVYNQASWLVDHTLYWNNREQFVAQIACLLARQSDWFWRDTSVQMIVEAIQRRAPRVAGLMLARSICLVSVLIAGLEYVNPWLRQIGAVMRRGISTTAILLPESIGNLLERLMANANVWLGRLGVILIIVAWYLLIRAAWLFWDYREAHWMFERKMGNSSLAAAPFFLVAAFPPLLGSFAWLLYALSSEGLGTWAILAAISLVVLACSVIFGWLGLAQPLPQALLTPELLTQLPDADGSNQSSALQP